MCGIVGCVTGAPDLARVLISGLERLEYRGYDSAGIAVLHDDEVHTFREVGKLSNLRNAINGHEIPGGLGIGHTRWATHGRPTRINAHPHRDESGRIVCVHNGIIENFRDLKEELQAESVTFSSDTDSEVIAHLIGKYHDGDLVEAVRKTVRRLEGAWAIGVIHASHPDRLVGARKDCPLVIGLGDDENFLASDVPAVLGRTDEVVFLDDGEIAEIRRDGVRIVDLDGADVELKPTKINWTLSEAERGGYAHFMLKEIHEQPITISETLLGRLDDDHGEIVLDGLQVDDDVLRGVERIHILACGTSWHAGHVAKFYLEKFARVHVDVDYASEFRYRDPVVDDKCLVLAVSQSGETADTIAAVRMAKEKGCRLISVVNVIGSTLHREADGHVMTHAGIEIGVAATKTFTAQLVSLLLFSLRMGRARGTLTDDAMPELLRHLRQLPQLVETALQQEDAVRQVASRYIFAHDFLFIGRGFNYPIALEGALKLKEISYIHAEGYPAGEMKHGPIALVEAKTPIVAIATKSSVYEKVMTNIEEARVRDAKVIVVATEGDEAVREVADDILWVPEAPPELSPIVNVVPLQLLSYHIARELGCDIDQPRNLAKSVTVE